MRAYKRTTSRNGGIVAPWNIIKDGMVVTITSYMRICSFFRHCVGGDGDDWVEKGEEFENLLLNLVFFNRLFWAFDAVDTGEGGTGEGWRRGRKGFERGVCLLCGRT